MLLSLVLPSEYFPNTQLQTTLLADDRTVTSTDAFYFYRYCMYFSFRANYSIKLCCENSFKLWGGGNYFAIFSMNRNKKNLASIYLRREKNELKAKQKVMPAAQ